MAFAKKIGALAYCETSALTGVGVEALFDTAVRILITSPPSRKQAPTK
jgi:hypothetical protein